MAVAGQTFSSFPKYRNDAFPVPYSKTASFFSVARSSLPPRTVKVLLQQRHKYRCFPFIFPSCLKSSLPQCLQFVASILLPLLADTYHTPMPI
jgi:hypothetical protein